MSEFDAGPDPCARAGQAPVAPELHAEFERRPPASMGGAGSISPAARSPSTLVAGLSRAPRVSDLEVCREAREGGLLVAAWREHARHRYFVRDAERITLVYFMRGERLTTISTETGERRCIVRAGETAVLSAGAGAAWLCAGPMQYLLAAFPSRFARNCGSMQVEGFCCFENDHVLRRLGFVLADFAKRDERLDEAEACAWSVVLGRHLARHYGACRAALRGERAGSAYVGDIRVVVDFIERNLQTPLSVRRLAAVAGVSRARFVRLFKSATGLAPHRFVVERRVSKARQLLASTQLSLTQVAYAVGFSSQSHMTSTFHRCVGATPGAYRDALRRR